MRCSNELIGCGRPFAAPMRRLIRNHSHAARQAPLWRTALTSTPLASANRDVRGAVNDLFVRIEGGVPSRILAFLPRHSVLPHIRSVEARICQVCPCAPYSIQGNFAAGEADFRVGTDGPAWAIRLAAKRNRSRASSGGRPPKKSPSRSAEVQRAPPINLDNTAQLSARSMGQNVLQLFQ